jgi:23S rRNA pseudouridine1911/1915/1917 synthase
MKLAFHISPDDHGRPAHDVLSEKMRMSGQMIKKIRLYGRLLVNGSAARMKDPVSSGDLIEAAYEDELGTPQIRSECSIRVLHDDEWMIVCEKPSDLVTHPSWQHMDDSLIQRLSSGRLHPVMRLDRETSGLIVVAKNGHAHHLISSMPMEKEYVGIVYGQFEPSSGIIDCPIGRADNSIMIRVVRSDGRTAITEYSTIAHDDAVGLSVVRFVLRTGRCHQIRVHSRHLGHPIVGDGLYGPLSRDYKDPDFAHIEYESMINRQALHASHLLFHHPISGEMLEFISPMPADMQKLSADFYQIN